MILVVDNDKDTATGLAELLEIEGLQAEPVFGGAEALERLTRHQYDCVLLDLRMPAPDGLAVLTEIRRRNLQVSVILCSASPLPLQQIATEFGVPCLTKPFEVELLLHMLRSPGARSIR